LSQLGRRNWNNLCRRWCKLSLHWTGWNCARLVGHFYMWKSRLQNSF